MKIEKVLVFGNGKLAVNVGTEGIGETPFVSIHEHNEKGVKVGDKGIVCGCVPTTILSFRNKESIDVLQKALRKAKKFL